MNSLSGVITSAFLNQRLSNVNVKIVLDEDDKTFETITNEQGIWSLDINKKIKTICFSKDGYISKVIYSSSNLIRPIRLLEDELIGFQTKMAFNPGEKVSTFINSTSSYQAELLRHGKNTEVLQDLGVFPPSTQEIPDDFFVENGINWKLSFEYLIPDSAAPGLYSLKLTPINENQRPYFLTFIVSTKKSEYGQKSKLLVLISSNNWQTYNIWGGRSRYRNFEHMKIGHKSDTLRTLWIKYIPELIKDKTKKILRKIFPITLNDSPSNFQFKRLSINRPHPNCSIEDDKPEKPFTSHLAASEWRLLAWLEKNNFNYDVVSGFELHNNPTLLKNYSGFILSSHCEYWSKEMYNGLKEYFYSGGSVLNLSGNSIYREIEFYEDGSLRCISLRFSESAADESEILGVRFDMRGYGTCAPYKILKPDHWVFDGLDISKGHVFGVKSLNQPTSDSYRKFEANPASSPGLTNLFGNGASGWETDKIIMTAPKDIVLIAKGMNGKRGGADMIVRDKNDKHGLLFSASSITFAGSLLVDKISARIVLNLLRKVLN